MKRLAVLTLILAMLVAFVGCRFAADWGTPTPGPAGQPEEAPVVSENERGADAEPPGSQPISGKLTVHFLDVGQADSILVQFPNGQSMLVDAGNNADGPMVVSYLKSKGVSRIDYLVGTHPHEDHIGGLDTVIQSFEIGKVYMPRATTTTKTFEDVLRAVQAKGLKINVARAGVTVLDQGGLKVSFLAPVGAGYEDLNNWSAVTRTQFGDTAFLLTGDAEALSEQEMLAAKANLKGDVLKVGHHGSSSSTSPAFLKAVSPKYAVISVGAGNDYGHPHQETLQKLAAAGVKVYRTDQCGTVVMVSDGKTITVQIVKTAVQPRAPNGGGPGAGVVAPAPVVNPGGASQAGYIGNKNSKKFHLPTCSTLPAPQNRVYFKTREEAVAAGYVACKRCSP